IALSRITAVHPGSILSARARHLRRPRPGTADAAAQTVGRDLDAVRVRIGESQARPGPPALASDSALPRRLREERPEPLLQAAAPAARADRAPLVLADRLRDRHFALAGRAVVFVERHKLLPTEASPDRNRAQRSPVEARGQDVASPPNFSYR